MLKDNELKKIRVLFICRGSTKHGIGHITRTKKVAGTMNRFANVKVIIIGEEFTLNLFRNERLDVTIVKNDREVMDVFNSFQSQVTVFDLTEIDLMLFREINSSNITISISPIFNCLQHVDLFFHRSGIHELKNSTKPLARCDLMYTVVSDHCYKIEQERYLSNLANERLSFAISMGGTDAANKTLKVLDAVKKVPGKMLIWVLLGEGYAHCYQYLVDTIRDTEHEIILAKTNDSMWRVLASCSFIVLAGGTTTYEAVYAGLPSINLVEGEDKYYLIEEIINRGVGMCAGTDLDKSLAKLIAIITDLKDNRTKLANMHKRSKGLIDSNGADRIVGEILKYINSINDVKVINNYYYDLKPSAEEKIS